MGKLIRAISHDGSVMMCVADTTDIVYTAEQYHKTSAVVTAALGRLLTACSMMGAQLKGKEDSITPVSYTHLDVYKRQAYSRHC